MSVTELIQVCSEDWKALDMLTRELSSCQNPIVFNKKFVTEVHKALPQIVENAKISLGKKLRLIRSTEPGRFFTPLFKLDLFIAFYIDRAIKVLTSEKIWERIEFLDIAMSNPQITNMLKEEGL